MDIISKLSSAIATGEGFFAPGNPPPIANNNPGDLKASPLNLPKDVHGFVKFTKREQGIAALYQQLALMILRGETLRQVISIWAPPTDGNNTTIYLQETARRLGFSLEDIDKPLWNWLDIEHIP